MSDDQSMSVKAFLDGGKDHQEVRRFGMPENLATNFSALKAKICSVFNIGNQDIIITWKDSDGDFIVISSDEELVEAIADSLSRQKLQVFRVNVTIRSSSGGQGPSSGTQGNQQGDIHEGVVCDVCDKTIVGFRYNCVTCQDFDLCGVCESKGMHKEHKMIRMPKPPSRGEPRFWWKEHEGPGGQHSTQFGMQSGGNEEEGNSFSFASSSSGPSPHAHVGGWCGWGPWMGRGGRPCNRAGGRGHGGWRGWWGKNWNGARGNGGFWQGQGQTLGGSASQQQQQQQQQQSQSQGRAQENQQEQHQSQQNSSRNDGDCPWTNTSGGSCPFSNGHPGIPVPDPAKVAEDVQYAAQEAQKMAHHVAHHFATQMATDQVANVMKGIWTAWAGQQPQGASTSQAAAAASASTSSSSSSSTSSKDNENPRNGQTQNTSNGPSPSPNEQFLRNVGESVASMLEPMGIDVDVSVEHNGIRQRCSLNDSDLQSRNSPTSKSPTAPSTPVPQTYNIPPSSSSANMEVQTESPGNALNDMEISSPPGVETQMESDIEEWTMVNRDSNSPENRPSNGTKPRSNSPENRPASETNQSTSAAEGPVSYPDLQQFQTHPDPKIQRALEQMQSMGYNNEGGWLSNLLDMKQGDINQVLDLLQPVSK